MLISCCRVLYARRRIAGAEDHIVAEINSERTVNTTSGRRNLSSFMGGCVSLTYETVNHAG